MSCGPITHACRVFLSRHEIYPGSVSRALIKATRRNCLDPSRRLQLQGAGYSIWIQYRGKGDEAYLEYHAGSGNTLLKVKRATYWYRELGNGLADLIIFGAQLPEAVCVGLPRDTYRLNQLVEHKYDRFYAKSDPLVRRLRNGHRAGRSALIITLVPTWRAENWRYSDGRDEWRE